jgi:hypothetical protein
MALVVRWLRAGDRGDDLVPRADLQPSWSGLSGWRLGLSLNGDRCHSARDGDVLGAGPILGVTTVIAIRSSAGWPVGAVPVDSFFHRVGTTVSYAVPLVVLVAVLLGHALRERRPAFAVAGSVILQYVVSLAFLLQASPSEPNFLAGLLQWNLVALGGYSLVWLALGRRIRRADQRDADVLLGGQIYATVALLGVLGIWAALSVVLTPGEFAPRGQPLGQWLTFLGWFAACTAAVWYAWTRQHRTVASLLRPAVACSWLLVALIAAAVDPWDVYRNWWAYHVLTCGGLLLTTVLTIGWWRHPALIWDAAASGGLVFLLGIRGGWSDAHPWAPWWSVAACGAVAVQWAALFVPRPSSRLGVCLGVGRSCRHDHLLVRPVPGTLAARRSSGGFRVDRGRSGRLAGCRSRVVGSGNLVAAA